MKTHIFPALKLTLLCLLLFSGAYTGIVWAIAQLAPNHGKGEQLTDNGRTYYVNIGQSFTGDGFFQSRPSAVGYNAAASGGSNFGPSNPGYLAEVKARIDTFQVHNPEIRRSEIPVDLVTASGSGLDPDLSLQAARVQVPRIAKIRNLSQQELYRLIATTSRQPLFGLFGPATVNVLELNTSLEHIQQSK